MQRVVEPPEISWIVMVRQASSRYRQMRRIHAPAAPLADPAVRPKPAA
jgi:hypothetical protein